MTKIFSHAALAVAASGMALAVPAAAAPATHGAPVSMSAYTGDTGVSQNAEHHRRWHRGGHGNRGYNQGYSNGYYGQQQAYYGEPVYNDTRIWRDRRDGNYYCRKRDGTTGLLIGAAGGALLGREIAGRNGDRTLGAILGAAGGALLGRQIDRGSARCR